MNTHTLRVLIVYCSIFVFSVNTNDPILGRDGEAPSTSDILVADEIFLKKIFDKYGDTETINFEGFEHLLDNLGLGGNLFHTPHELNLHKINGSFKQIHDNTHRHKRHSVPRNESFKIGKCLSPIDLLEIYNLETNPGVTSINHKTFMKLCPALVYQLDQRLCYKIADVEKNINEIHLAWIYTGLSILLISATGLLAVALMPIIHSKIFGKLLHFMVAMAVGTLCGDALLHLLPHSLIPHEQHSHEDEDHNIPIFKCSIAFITIFTFYTLESILRIATGSKDHGHLHSIKDRRRSDVLELDFMLDKKTEKTTSPVALMVILGDTLHNITDGLAIGAAFSSDPVTGFATSLAVFFHELPHELGDFAVLLRSGMSMKKALFFNLLSSILSFVGAAAGLWLAEDHAYLSQWIYAATAGTFLYIGLADLIPELNENGNKSMIEVFLSLIGIVSGGAIMLSIALYEDSLKTLLEK